jgi:hypothetical protein
MSIDTRGKPAMTNGRIHSTILSALLIVTLSVPADAFADKRALIVTVGEYQADTGWRKISSNNDLPLIEYALSRHGFTDNDIVHLPETEATLDGIKDAIRAHLIEPSGTGDIAVFHYSGHGQQITDNGHDELDGYDETLVPVDAPKRPPATYTGAKHLRDDDLGDLLYELRARIGPTGDVLVFLDSCYSGTGTRGDGYPDPVRGSLNPIGPPRQEAGQTLELDQASGFFDASARSRGAMADGPESLAPIVVISAETHNRLAEETTNEKGEEVGALSWALSKALADSGDQTSYRDLYESVRRHTAARHIPNSPQAEGDLDRLLFAGQAVDQQPFFRVNTMNIDEGWAELDGGGLLGLLPGAIVEVHKVGTHSPDETSLVAKGKIEGATPFVSEVIFSDIANRNENTGWAFLTDQSFGSLQVNVYVDAPADSSWGKRVRDALALEAAKPQELIVMLDARPEGLVSSDAQKIVLVREIRSGPPSKRGVMLETWETGQPLLNRPIQTSSNLLASDLVGRIKKYAQNSYLRALDVQAEGMKVELDIIPCKLQCNSALNVCGGEECSCIEEGHPREFLDDGNDIRMTLGTGFGVRLKNVGTKPVYATVLDLMPDGSVGLLWPLSAEANEDTLIEPATAYRIPDPKDDDNLLVYRACPPFGTDMLKVIATTEPVDFGPITRGQRTRGGNRGPLDVLFEQSLVGTRGIQPTFAVGSVSTSSLVLTVEQPD